MGEHTVSMSGYYVGTVPEALVPEVRPPDFGSRVQGLAASISSSAEDLALRQSLYARERTTMEDRLAAMQQHAAALRQDQAAAEEAWWREKDALLAGWTGNHERLAASMGADAGLPMAPGPVVPFDAATEDLRLAGDRVMSELSMLRYERSLAAVPERRAAESRVRALEIQLARENHAREFASYANADRGIGAFKRQPTGTRTVPLGDKLNGQLYQTESESLRARVGHLQGRVSELETQLAAASK